MKKYITSLAVLFLLIGCGQESTEGEDVVAEDSTAFIDEQEDVSDLNGYYKSYVGVIADIPVTVNIVQYSNTISGTYYYDKIGQIINLYGTSNPDSATGKIILTEDPAVRSEDVSSIKWVLDINENIITGNWIDKKTHKSYKIDLKEDYTSAIPLGVIYKEDDRYYKGKETEPHATNTYQYIFPKRQDAKYVFTAIGKLTSCDVHSRNTLAQCIDKKNEEYYEVYFKDLADMEEQGVYDKGYALNYGAAENQYVYYNSNGWLCVSSYLWMYTGGAHGNYNSSYTCIDVSGTRIWSLDDVINDKAALLPIVEKDVRKQFAIRKGQPLNSRLLVDEMHVTDNFFLTNKGLTFVYTSYEIASYADGEVSVFVPYEQIAHLLTPAFKKRMNMNEPI
ncbi:MAG: DUF3298 domain-containing protein [Flavipsychrobacter sp.]